MNFKLIILSFLLLLLSIPSHILAQESVKYGPVAGYISRNDIFTIDGNDIIDGTNTRNGFFIGFFADIPLSEKTHFQPELLFADFEASSISSTLSPR